MQNLDDDFILSIAHAVRSWAVKKAFDDSMVKYDFHAEHDLSCMCGYASTILLGCLHHFGVESAILAGSGYHIYVMIGDRVLDITATQFKKEPGFHPNEVEFTLHSELTKQYRESSAAYWRTKYTKPTLTEAFSYLCPGTPNGFPEEQYWTSMSDMLTDLLDAIEYCAHQGLEVQEPERLAA